MTMKKTAVILSLLIAISTLQTFAEDNSQKIIDKVVSTYKAVKGLSAHYAITTDQGVTEGTIIMQGDKFRMISNDLRCWYDGKILWSYSPMSGEVNITEPSAEELQMINPYSIISSFRNAFTTRQVKSSTASNHEVELLPKVNNPDIKSVRLTISRKTYLPVKIVFALADCTSIIIILSQTKGGANYPETTFMFEKSLVPAGTPVIDLR